MPPATCPSDSRASKASAGGQLEHPSEVNSSTTTGVRVISSVAEEACAGGRTKARAATNAEEIMIKTASRCFIRVVSFPSAFEPRARQKVTVGTVKIALFRITVMIALTGYYPGPNAFSLLSEVFQ